MFIINNFKLTYAIVKDIKTDTGSGNPFRGTGKDYSAGVIRSQIPAIACPLTGQICILFLFDKSILLIIFSYFTSPEIF